MPNDIFRCITCGTECETAIQFREHIDVLTEDRPQDRAWSQNSMHRVKRMEIERFGASSDHQCFCGGKVTKYSGVRGEDPYWEIKCQHCGYAYQEY